MVNLIQKYFGALLTDGSMEAGKEILDASISHKDMVRNIGRVGLQVRARERMRGSAGMGGDGRGWEGQGILAADSICGGQQQRPERSLPDPCKVAAQSPAHPPCRLP